MTPNSLYPGFVKLHHEAANAEHVYTIPVVPYLNGEVWYLRQKGSPTGQPFGTCLVDYCTVMKAMLPNAATFTYAELWTMDAVDADPVFRDAATLNIVGTGGTGYSQASQYVVSFRTTGGGQGRAQLMDCTFAVNLKFRPPYSSQNLAVATYLLGAASIFAGRDGTYPIAIPKILTKTNDALRRRYNLV